MAKKVGVIFKFYTIFIISHFNSKGVDLWIHISFLFIV